MGASASPGAAHPPDVGPEVDFVAFFDQNLGQMPVTRAQTHAVVDFDHIPKSAVAPRHNHDPGGRRKHQLARRAGQIDARVKRDPLGEGVGTASELAGNVKIIRRRREWQDPQDALERFPPLEVVL